jgi:hypothetical protein
MAVMLHYNTTLWYHRPKPQNDAAAFLWTFWWTVWWTWCTVCLAALLPCCALDHVL